jgi:hypothetical protein
MDDADPGRSTGAAPFRNRTRTRDGFVAGPSVTSAVPRLSMEIVASERFVGAARDARGLIGRSCARSVHAKATELTATITHPTDRLTIHSLHEAAHRLRASRAQTFGVMRARGRSTARITGAQPTDLESTGDLMRRVRERCGPPGATGVPRLSLLCDLRATVGANQDVSPHA